MTPPRENVFDLEAHRPGYSMGRIRAALAGRYDAAQLSDDESLIFDDLLGEAMGTVETPAAHAFWVSFEGQRNTDIE
jgi:hypothetical protein